MLSSVVCRCLFRLMRRYFPGRWICLLVSERLRLVWQCCPFGCNTYIQFCVHWHGGPADAVSSGIWPIIIKVLTLSVAICPVFEFRSWFFKHWGQNSNLSRRHPLLTRVKNDAVWIYGLSESHDNLSMPVFYVVNKWHPFIDELQ